MNGECDRGDDSQEYGREGNVCGEMRIEVLAILYRREFFVR